MKRGLIAATAVALLLLAGCTSESTESAPQRDASAGTVTPTPVAQTSAPAVASPAPAAPVEVSAAPPKQTAATDVLVGIQLTVAGYGVEVTADQIESAANYACDQIAAGADTNSIVALTGDIPEDANLVLVQLAANEYCPIR